MAWFSKDNTCCFLPSGKPGTTGNYHGGTNDGSWTETETGEKASSGESESAQRTSETLRSSLPTHLTFHF